MRTTREENAELGRIIAGKLNVATGPTALALPLAGVSMLDAEGEDFYDPDTREALFDALHEHLDDDVEVLEVDATVNDEAFAAAAAAKLHEYMRAR